VFDDHHDIAFFSQGAQHIHRSFDIASVQAREDLAKVSNSLTPAGSRPKACQDKLWPGSTEYA
jgi:hypothetical protein